MIDVLKITNKYRDEIFNLYNTGFNTSNIYNLINKHRISRLQKILPFLRKNHVKKGSLRNVEAYILYSLIKEFKIQNILDIGTGNGFSSLICAKALKGIDLVKKKIITIDLVDRVNDFKLKKIFSDLDLINYVDFKIGDSHEVLKNNIQEIDKFDLVIIDGYHSYNHVKKELNLIKKFLSRKSIIFFDDIFKDKEKSIYEAMIEFKNENNGLMVIIDTRFYDTFDFKEDRDDINRKFQKWKLNKYHFINIENPKNKSALIFINF